ncbi:Ig-like domain-containing protein [Cohnella nanjingensis]|uniref:Ig-like domain-containing protein n=1 Tax=Cohnella nanjingensis TaxID=1387779 RepID=A0A7X0RRL5_9BACL|nr:Ig-like domain-containing protein [Cohnella nanjingensis]MBB6672378.1 Ig-like domain-containing protein [Cohnella nanjingensis]
MKLGFNKKVWLIFCLTACFMLPAMAYADEGAPPANLIEVYRTDGQLLDFDAEKALVYEPQSQKVRIEQLDGSASIEIATDIATKPDQATLTTEGAIFHLPGVKGESIEYRNGTLQRLQAYYWTVNGPYVAYYDSSGTDGSMDGPGTNGLRLRHGNTVETIVNPINHYWPLGEAKILDDGTVLYSFVDQLFRYQAGTSTALTKKPTTTNERESDDNKIASDGQSILYLNFNPEPVLQLLTDSEPITLFGPYSDLFGKYADILRQENLAIAGGWAAFPRLDEDRQVTLWLRSPEGEEKQIGSGNAGYKLQALSPAGDVVYSLTEEGSTRYFLNRAGAEGRTRVEAEVPSGEARWLNDAWWFSTDTGVYKLSEGEPSIESLTADPGELSLLVGEERQLAIIANITGGQAMEVTKDSEYVSSDPTVSTVVQGGLVKGVAAGTSQITASYRGKEVKVAVKVENAAPTVQRLFFTPSELRTEVGVTKTFQLFAKYSDGTERDVTAEAELISSDSSVAALTTAGNEVKGIATGSAFIHATFGGAAATLTVNVAAPSGYVKELFTLGKKWKLSVGQSRNLVVYADYSDGRWEDVSIRSAYSSSNPAVASVDAEGKVQALSPGVANVKITFNGAQKLFKIKVSK